MVQLDKLATDEEAAVIPELEEAELAAEDELTSAAAPIFEEEAAAPEVFTFFCALWQAESAIMLVTIVNISAVLIVCFMKFVLSCRIRVRSSSFYNILPLVFLTVNQCTGNLPWLSPALRYSKCIRRPGGE